MKPRKLVLTNLLAFISLFCFSQEYMEMIEDGTYTVSEIQNAAETYFAEAGKGRGTGYKQFKRWEYNALTTMDETGHLKSQEFYFEEIERHNAYQNKRKSANANSNWEELGPTYYNATVGYNPGVGRISGFAIDRNNTDHIVIGSPNGGVWKTKDEGENVDSVDR